MSGFRVENPDVQSNMQSILVFSEKNTLLVLDSTGAILALHPIKPHQFFVFLSPDPHHQNYPSNSPYNAFADNPIIYSDPDGRDIIFNVYKQADGTVKIHIVVNAKLIDETRNNYTLEQMNVFTQRIKNGMEQSYTFKELGYDVSMEVNISVQTPENMLTKSDHAFRLRRVDEMPDFQGGFGVPEQNRGVAPWGQKIMFLSEFLLDKTPHKPGERLSEDGHATLEGTSAHEFGHSAFLEHPELGTMPGNLMNQSYSGDAGMKMNINQILISLQKYDEGYLNQEFQDENIFPRRRPYIPEDKRPVRPVPDEAAIK